MNRAKDRKAPVFSLTPSPKHYQPVTQAGWLQPLTPLLALNAQCGRRNERRSSCLVRCVCCVTPSRHDGGAEEKSLLSHLPLPNTHVSAHMKHSVFSQSQEQSRAFSLLNGSLQVTLGGGIKEPELALHGKKGEKLSLGISAVWSQPCTSCLSQQPL